jgi:hypothetical protein
MHKVLLERQRSGDIGMTEEWAGFEQYFLFSLTAIFLDTYEKFEMLAEVVGSTPILSIFISLVTSALFCPHSRQLSDKTPSDTNAIKSIVKTNICQAPQALFTSGRMKVVMDDGTEEE